MDDLPIAECRLDLAGLRVQRDRYRRLGRAVRHVERTAQTLTVEFTADVDTALLAETIAVESECCPFFEMRYDAGAQELVVSVGRPEQDPTLDALVAALDAPSDATSQANRH
jgi:hypothetical protein